MFIVTITLILMVVISIYGIVRAIQMGRCKSFGKFWTRYFGSAPRAQYYWIEMNSCDIL